MVTGKKIGNQFERRTAQMFSEGMGGEFVRTPSSGAFIGGANRKRLEVLGQNQARLFDADLIAPDEWKNIVVECKKRAKIPFRQFVEINGCKLLNQWLEQVFQNYKPNDGKIYFLVFAEKFSPIFICYPSSYCFPHGLHWTTPTGYIKPDSQNNSISYYSYVKTISEEGPTKFIIHELSIQWLKDLAKTLKQPSILPPKPAQPPNILISESDGG